MIGQSLFQLTKLGNMTLEDIKSEEMVAQYIEGCLNDFESCIATKQETELHIHRLIIYLIKLDRKNHEKL